ncbi:hypothetical protein Tco_1139106 [Tanacetum coccineum]
MNLILNLPKDKLTVEESLRRKSKKKVSISADEIIIPEPDVALESTRRRPSGIAFRDTSSVSKKKSPDQSQKLKGIQTMTAKEQVAVDTKQALKASKKLSRSQPHARGSSEGIGVSPGVPDESTIILTTSSEGISTKTRVPDEVKGSPEAEGDSTTDWGSKEVSEYSDEEHVDEEIEWLTTDEKEEKKDDDEDDKSINHEKTDDDEETDDEFVHGDEYVHNDVDEEMKDAEVTKTRKDSEKITDVEKTYAEKTEITKGDLKQAGKLPLTSFSLSVSSGFEVTHIQSPSILTVPVLVIPEPIILSPIHEIPSVTPATTLLPPPSFTNLTPVLQQIKTPIPTPPITTVAPVATTVPDLLLTIAQRVYVLEKDVQELKQVDHSPTILATIRSQVPAAIDEYLGSSLGDALQKVLQKHTKELIQQSSQKDVYDIIKIKQKQAAKEQMPKFSATPYDQTVEAKFKQKDILFKMMRESYSYKKHLKHKAMYDALMPSIIQDEDDLDRVVLDLRKRDHEEDEDPSVGSK